MYGKTVYFCVKKYINMQNSEMARFDTQLTKEQKEFFEYASQIGGFRTLTDFVLTTVQSKAEEIVKEHNKIIASKRDQEIFFDLVFSNPPKPNKELKAALKEYNEKLRND